MHNTHTQTEHYIFAYYNYNYPDEYPNMHGEVSQLYTQCIEDVASGSMEVPVMLYPMRVSTC